MVRSRNPRNKKPKVEKTNRGFSIVRFKDEYGYTFTLQQSSLATKACIWFGPNDVDAKILASEAHLAGVKTEETTGWVAFPIPPQVSMHTRAHMSRKQVKQLIRYLTCWLRTGYFTERG